MRIPPTLPLITLLLAAASSVRADDLLPPGTPVETAVDHYLDARLKEEGLTPAPQADDANLVRRLTLDLVGRIPTAAEARAYCEATAADKRLKLVERLMASPGLVRHQAAVFDVMLMDGTAGSLRDYLLKAFAEDRPWDQMFRDLLLPDEKDPKQHGAAVFLRQRLGDLDKLTNEVSTLFFGVNVSCAKCHDHPRVPDWKQDHFYGMKAFFNRTFDNGGFVAERGYGLVKFKTTGGKERQARLMFLTGKVVEEPSAAEPSAEEQKKERERLEVSKKNKTPPPPPPFSARAQLVALALQPGQRDFFARSIVNRVWHRLFGYGLVMPVDQMHAENPASHPELLQWLARDLVQHRYDLRRLTRGLVLSRGYARGSRWEGGEAPRPALFAVAAVRPLTPVQLANSLRLAAADPASWPATLKPGEFEKRMEGLENSARGLVPLFEQPHEDFQVGVSEALFFSNGERLQKDLLADGGDRLVGRLKQIKDRRELIDTAVRNVLARPALDEEVRLLGEFLARRADRPAAACRQLVWALLAGAEFRFNY
jgi:hypothetical protein